MIIAGDNNLISILFKIMTSDDIRKRNIEQESEGSTSSDISHIEQTSPKIKGIISSRYHTAFPSLLFENNIVQ